MTMRKIAMTLRSVLAREVYVRFGGDEEFTCTTRYAGFRVWAQHFNCMQPPHIQRIEQSEPGPPVRQTDCRIRIRRSFED